MSTETLIGTGINVFTSDARTVGKIRFRSTVRLDVTGEKGQVFLVSE